MAIAEQTIEYRDKRVGKIESQRGLSVFVWRQDEFRVFSTHEEKSYSMGVGLLDELENMEIDLVQVGGKHIFLGEIQKGELLFPDNSVFESPPPEPQYLISVPVEN